MINYESEDIVGDSDGLDRSDYRCGYYTDVRGLRSL